MKRMLLATLITSSFWSVSCKKKPISSSPQPVTTDSFALTVNNGYGSGKYKAGDTVHIFSENYSTNQLFDKWNGDTALLNDPEEWHTWFIMPAKNVTVTGSLINITPFTLHYEQIMGKERLKPVYYYFPSGYKGIVYLLHGTGGSAADLIASYEWMQLIKDLVYNHFAVIITESEESTTGIDANGDGKIRWDLLSLDTNTNVDFANIRIITDSLYSKGIADPAKPRYAIGMSDGGFFAAALTYVYHFEAAVQFCAQGPSNLMQLTTIPTQFCMAANDDNPSVGTAGDAAALAYSESLNNRGVCSKYYANPRSPLYPERFARSGEMTIAQSEAVFNELKAKGYMDNRNYFIGYSDNFTQAYQSNPSDFPAISSLSAYQAVLSEINISVADHHMYSDYDNGVIRFLENKCQ